jgi:hypothetical protein
MEQCLCVDSGCDRNNLIVSKWGLVFALFSLNGPVLVWRIVGTKRTCV